MRMLELKIPPAIQVVIAAALMWLVARITPGVALDADLGALLYRSLTIVGAAVLLWGAWSFRKMKTTLDPTRPEKASALVVTGVYRFTRNPMYLGFLFLLAGWAAFLASAWSLLVIPGFVAWMNRFQIRPEEKALADKFGREFEDYRSRVRRWI